MSNNTIELSGYLSVTKADWLKADGQSLPSIQGSISTDKPFFGGRHPFIAIGKPAEVVLDYARENSRQECLMAVSARGKLVSLNRKSFLEVKHIEFFEVSNPGPGGHEPFWTNSAKLQGYLSVSRKNLVTVSFAGLEVRFIEADIATGKEVLGGKHTVLLEGKYADFVLDLAGAMGNAGEIVSIEATVGGKLLSFNGTSYVQANFISLNASHKSPIYVASSHRAGI